MLELQVRAHLSHSNVEVTCKCLLVCQSPSQQCQSTDGKNITFHGLVYPKLTLGSSNFDHLIAPGYLGEG